MTTCRLVVFLAVALTLASVSQVEAAPTHADYRQLQEHRLGAAVALPDGGLSWSIDSSA